MQLTERLREINLGVCEGMSFGDMYTLILCRWTISTMILRSGALRAETAECTERIVSAVTEIAVKTTVRLSLLSATAWRSALLLAHILGVASRDIPHRFRTATTPP